jgi:hypothetical protein
LRSKTPKNIEQSVKVGCGVTVAIPSIDGRETTRWRWLRFVLLVLASTGCGVEFGPLEARDAWSARGAPLAESMLPVPESWTMPDHVSPFHHLFGAGFAGGAFNGHDACGPEDEACAARLRSAPVNAGDWQNRFPLF